jgi:hypothetical protein
VLWSPRRGHGAVGGGRCGASDPSQSPVPLRDAIEKVLAQATQAAPAQLPAGQAAGQAHRGSMPGKVRRPRSTGPASL